MKIRSHIYSNITQKRDDYHEDCIFENADGPNIFGLGNYKNKKDK